MSFPEYYGEQYLLAANYPIYTTDEAKIYTTAESTRVARYCRDCDVKWYGTSLCWNCGATSGIPLLELVSHKD